MTTHDTKTMYNFEKYLELQRSDELNMVSPEVRDRLGISREEHLYILNNYDELLKEYEELKVVDEIIDEAKNRAESESGKEQTRGLNNELGEEDKEDK